MEGSGIGPLLDGLLLGRIVCPLSSISDLSSSEFVLLLSIARKFQDSRQADTRGTKVTHPVA